MYLKSVKKNQLQLNTGEGKKRETEMKHFLFMVLRRDIASLYSVFIIMLHLVFMFIDLKDSIISELKVRPKIFNICLCSHEGG